MVSSTLKGAKRDEWRKDERKIREVGSAIYKVLHDEEQTNSILNIVKQQHEY